MSTQVINARAQAAQGVITLSPPAAGDQYVFQALDGLKVALGFPADGATMAQDGQNLTFSFPDGGQIVLTDFFAQYGTGAAPSFIVEGQELPGDAFLTAFNADLLPAAGPAGGGGGGSGGVGDYQSDPGALINTVDRLGALDPSQFPNGVPQVVLTDNGLVDNGVTLLDLTDPALGLVDGQVFESGLSAGRESRDLPPNGNESAGSGVDPAATVYAGTFTVVAPDGLGTLVIDGVTVFGPGGLTGNTVTSAHGTLVVDGYNPATGVVNYTFTLADNAKHDVGSDSLNETFTVTATDTDGDAATGNLSFEIVDDKPVVFGENDVKVDESFYLFSKVAEGDTGNSIWQGHSLHKEGTLSFKAGADGVKSIVFDPAIAAEAVSSETDAESTTTLPQLTSQGYNVHYELSDDGHTLTGYILMEQPVPSIALSDGPSDGVFEPQHVTVFTMHIDNTGHYDYTQYRPLDHAVQGANNPEGNPNPHDDPLSFNIGVIVTDDDSDKAYGDIKVTVEDDGPFVIPSAAMVDESAFDHHNRLETAKAMNVDPKDREQQQDIWGDGYIHTSGKLAYFAGADGVGDFTLHTPSEQLTSHGEKVSFTVLPDGHTLIGYVGAKTPTVAGFDQNNTVMVITIDNKGHYDYTQYRPLDYSVDGLYPPATATKFTGFTPNPHDDALTVKIGVTITDGDGDTASSKIIVFIKDDGPEKATSGDNVVHDQLDSLHIDFGKTTISSNIFVGNKELTGSSIADPATGEDGWITDRVQMQVNGGTPFFSASGLGVTYDGKAVNTATDGPVRENEIGYRDQHTHGSIEHAAKQEGIVFELKGLANSFQLNASGAFFDENSTSKEGERGEVKFYLGSTEVAVGKGTFDKGTFTLESGNQLFDRVVIVPTDIDDKKTAGDNSDFYIKSVEFGFVSQVGTAEGTITPNYGADGKGDLTFETLSTEIYTYDGHKVTVAPTGDGHMLKGTYGTKGDVAFTISINPDTGEWNFEQNIPLDIDNSLKSKLTFNVTIKDGDGDTAPGTITVGITEHERAPDVDTGLSPHVVFEAGLNDPLHAVGSDNTHPATASTTGTFFINTAGEDLTEVTIAGHLFSSASTEAGHLLSDLANTTIKLNAHGLEAKDGDPVHATLTITGYAAGKVSYTYTLTDNVFHGDTIAGETFDRDKTGDIIPIKVTTAGGTADATLTVTIVDDTPKAVNDVADFTPGTNIIIMLDTSGSMGDASGVTNTNKQPIDRLDLARSAIDKMLLEYQKQGSINIKIVGFDADEAADQYDTPAYSHDGWYAGPNAIQNAHNYAQRFSPGGGTDYDDATKFTIDNVLKQPMPTAGRSVVYFISDGDPNSGQNLDSTEETAWTKALEGVSNLSMAYAIGIGSGVTTTYLNPVGWERGTSSDDNSTQIITDLNQLTKVLLSTVPVGGDLLKNDTLGADGARLQSVSYIDENGGVHTASWDDMGKATGTGITTSSDGKSITFDLGNGRGSVTIDNTGHYTYREGSNPTGAPVINYTIVDGDKDTSSATLTINLHGATIDAHDNFAKTTLTQVSMQQLVSGWETPRDSDGFAEYKNKKLFLNLDGGSHDPQDYYVINQDNDSKVSAFHNINVTKAGGELQLKWELTQGGDDNDDAKIQIFASKVGSNTSTKIYEGDKNGAGQIKVPFTSFEPGEYQVTITLFDPDKISNGHHWQSSGAGLHISALAYVPYAYEYVSGNVITDAVAGDVADNLAGLTGSVAEVNGVPILADNKTIAGHYGTLTIDKNGHYEYTADAGTAGHDEAFVYKLVSSTGQEDHATLNIHIGDAGTSVAHNYTIGGNVQVGDYKNNTLTGTDNDDYIVGGKGDDIIDGGKGHDYLDGGAGNDTIIAHDTTGDNRITDADFKGLHGGSGADTLKIVGDGVTLDFTNIANGKVSGIETIDLRSDTHTQTLTLGVDDVLDLGKTAEGHTITILTGAGDTVDFLKGTDTRVTAHTPVIDDNTAHTLTTTSYDVAGTDGTHVHLIVQQEIIKSGG